MDFSKNTFYNKAYSITQFIKRNALVLGVVFLSGSLQAQTSIDMETGLAWNTKNDIRYPNGPNSTANFFEATNDFGVQSTAFFRLRLSHIFGERHTVSLLYAPLSFESYGRFDTPTQFGSGLYGPDENTVLNYRFNSYRLTYRYRLVDKPKFKLGLGLTGKVRDARIAVSNGSRSDETTDLGLVPLINFNMEYRPFEYLMFTINGDALAAKQGRAEDIFAGVHYKVNDWIDLKGGYRILEGGADINQVYNFATVQYASLGTVIYF